MKRLWASDELIEHWTLLPADLALLANKAGATRLGFAILLKAFQCDARFPEHKGEVPGAVVAARGVVAAGGAAVVGVAGGALARVVVVGGAGAGAGVSVVPPHATARRPMAVVAALQRRRRRVSGRVRGDRGITLSFPG